jgi:uridine kinase
LFYKYALSLLIGNHVTITYQKNGIENTVKLHPAKLLVIEGSHIFMSPEATQNLSSLINLKVFIDSDSDVRLSRRVYQDVEEKKMNLTESVAIYL